MKAVILAGGLGTRLSEETAVKPKPMVEIGGRPILWHIMKMYSAHGIHDFVVCLGYKGYVIKEFFANYFLHVSDVSFDLKNNKVEVHQNNSEPWKVTLVETGESTMTGGRLRKVAHYIGNQDFCFTYGDGVSNVNIKELIEFHKNAGREATVTAVRPPERFGVLDFEEHKVTGFREKPQGDGAWINGGFFVLSPKVLEYISDDKTVWEQQPMNRLAATGQLSAYKHDGFWQPMDTMRDRIYLEDLWKNNKAPWKIW